MWASAEEVGVLWKVGPEFNGGGQRERGLEGEKKGQEGCKEIMITMRIKIRNGGGHGLGLGDRRHGVRLSRKAGGGKGE